MVRQVSFFHVDIKIVPFSDSAEDMFRRIPYPSNGRT